MVIEKSNNSSYGSKIVSGSFWNGLELVANKGFGFIVQLILAKLLLPQDFGIIGMAVVFSGLVSLISDLGLAAALIRYKSEKLERIHYDTAFWSSMIFSVVLFLLLIVVVTPFAVWFYHEPMLTKVLPIIGIQFLISTFNLIHRIILTRDLRFKSLSVINVTSSVVDGIFITALAFLGAGIWSIALKGIIASVIRIPLLWRATKWFPKFEFSKSALKDIMGFGVYDVVMNIFNYVTQNIDYLLIGKLLGSSLLGVYTFAFVITDTFRSQIMAVLNKVMFPIYGKLQGDHSAVKSYYLKVVKYNTIIILPVMAILFFFTEAIINLGFGEKWKLAIFPIQAMAISSTIQSISGTTDSVLRGFGLIKLSVKIFVLKTMLITIPAFAFGIYFYGINGAAIAMIVHKLVGRIIHQYYMKKIFHINEIDILKSLQKPFYGFLSICPIILFFCEFHTITNLYVLFEAISSVVIIFFITEYYLLKAEIHQIFKTRTL